MLIIRDLGRDACSLFLFCRHFNGTPTGGRAAEPLRTCFRFSTGSLMNRFVHGHPAYLILLSFSVFLLYGMAESGRESRQSFRRGRRRFRNELARRSQSSGFFLLKHFSKWTRLTKSCVTGVISYRG